MQVGSDIKKSLKTGYTCNTSLVNVRT